MDRMVEHVEAAIYDATGLPQEKCRAAAVAALKIIRRECDHEWIAVPDRPGGAMSSAVHAECRKCGARPEALAA